MKEFLMKAALWLSIITTSRAQIEEYNLETRENLIYNHAVSII